MEVGNYLLQLTGEGKWPYTIYVRVLPGEYGAPETYQVDLAFHGGRRRIHGPYTSQETAHAVCDALTAEMGFRPRRHALPIRDEYD